MKEEKTNYILILTRREVGIVFGVGQLCGCNTGRFYLEAGLLIV